MGIVPGPRGFKNNDYKGIGDVRMLEKPKILLNRTPNHPQDRRAHQTGRKFDARLDWMDADLQDGRKTSKIRDDAKNDFDSNFDSSHFWGGGGGGEDFLESAFPIMRLLFSRGSGAAPSW